MAKVVNGQHRQLTKGRIRVMTETTFAKVVNFGITILGLAREGIPIPGWVWHFGARFWSRISTISLLTKADTGNHIA
jgi:hypothetical protein